MRRQHRFYERYALTGAKRSELADEFLFYSHAASLLPMVTAARRTGVESGNELAAFSFESSRHIFRKLELKVRGQMERQAIQCRSVQFSCNCPRSEDTILNHVGHRRRVAPCQRGPPRC